MTYWTTSIVLPSMRFCEITLNFHRATAVARIYHRGGIYTSPRWREVLFLCVRDGIDVGKKSPTAPPPLEETERKGGRD